MHFLTAVCHLVHDAAVHRNERQVQKGTDLLRSGNRAPKSVSPGPGMLAMPTMSLLSRQSADCIDTGGRLSSGHHNARLGEAHWGLETFDRHRQLESVLLIKQKDAKGPSRFIT